MKDYKWYHVYSYKEYPATQYGFATDKKGIVVKANDKVTWMIGKHIDFINKFFEGKPAIVNEVMPSVSADTCKQQ